MAAPKSTRWSTCWPTTGPHEAAGANLDMNEMPPSPRDQGKVNRDHLDLLSVFHFVGAGLALLGILFLLAHFVFMRAVFANPRMWQGHGQSPPPAQFFALFRWLYLVFAIWLVASAILNLVSALFLRARIHRTFSLVVAAIDCLHVPLGTVLGVFTIIVLLRDTVRELYEARGR
jgi:hypothetical protein